MYNNLILETVLLKKTVVDLEDLVAFPDKYLVSIEKEFEEAKKIINKNIKKTNSREGAIYHDGALHMVYNGKTVFSFTQWTDIDDLWAYLLNLIEEYFEIGYSKCYFPDAPIEIKFEKSNKEYLYFSVDGVSIYINETFFINKLLSESKKFYVFLEGAVNCQSMRSELDRINKLTSFLNNKNK